MNLTQFPIGFHLFYCLFFKFADDSDCEQRLGLKGNLQEARRAVLFNGQGTGLGRGSTHMGALPPPTHRLSLPSCLATRN